MYVGNITASITEGTLSALFAHCGTVTQVRISGYGVSRVLGAVGSRNQIKPDRNITLNDRSVSIAQSIFDPSRKTSIERFLDVEAKVLIADR